MLVANVPIDVQHPRHVAAITEQDGEKEKALANLSKAKLLEPENPEILFDFGRICLQNNLVRDALPALERAVQLCPDNGPYAYALAPAYVGRLGCPEAVTILCRLVEKHIDDPTMDFAIAEVLHVEGTDLEGAEHYLPENIRL